MKIAYILPVNMKNYGYTKENYLDTHFSIEIARELARHDNDVSVHVFWDKTDLYTENNLKIYFYPVDFGYRFSEVSWTLLFHRFTPDTIIHLHEPNRLFFTFFKCIHKNLILVEHHGTGIGNPFSKLNLFYYLYGFIRRLFLSYQLNMCSYCIVHNKKAFHNLRKYVNNDKKIILSNNGINVLKFKPFNRIINRSQKTVTFLFVGRIIKNKGIYELVKSFEKLKLSFPFIQLMIAGPLEDDNYLDLVKPYAYGFKSGEELRELYKKADVFCLPTYAEAFAIVIIEALYYQLPIITTNLPELKAVIPSTNAIFIPPRDADALEKAMKQTLDPNVREGMSKNGKEYVLSKLTWEKVCAGYIILYKSMINQRNSF